MKNMKKKGTTSAIVVILLAIIAIGVVGVGYMAYTGKNSLSVAQATGPTPQGSGCAQPLSVAQTPAFQAFDVDNNTAYGTTNVIYTDAATGIQAVGANSVPGKGYTAYMNNASFTRTRVDYVTSCTEAAPQISGKIKYIDPTVTMTVYNQGGHTANSLAANQTLTASSTATVSLEMVPSQLRSHIAGETGQFAIFFNATNTTYWDTSLFHASGFASCEPYTGVNPVALGGTYVTGFICNGDFTGKDQATYAESITIGGSAIYAASGSTPTICVVPVDYYQNTLTNALSVGPVTNAGGAIHTPQCVVVALK